jgi:hypothetical protein
MVTKHFDAELHDWILVMYPTPTLAWPTIVGVVRNDGKGRFADGRTIRTSVLLTTIMEIREGTIVQTLNTRYLLGRAAQRN